jgi:hypothetical protein
METQNVSLKMEKSYDPNRNESTILTDGITDEQLRAAIEVRLPELLAPLPEDSALEIDLLA